MTILKKRRLAVGMTQFEVAEAMRISQPNYQRWEAGNAAVPKAQLKKLAKLFKTSVDDLLGKPAPFDKLAIKKDISDDRKYYGEVSIHFAKGKPLLLPITIATYLESFTKFQANHNFIVIESLDNRKVYIRNEAIADIYFSSDDYDNFGPEEYSEYLGILPDDDFWKIVEYLDDPEYLYKEFGKEKVDRVIKDLNISEDELEQLIKDGHVKEEERDQVKKDVGKRQNELMERAQCTYWQGSSGKIRSENIFDSKVLYESLSVVEDFDELNDEIICIPVERYHRTVMIKKSAIDFISIPKHKYHEGEIESLEEMIDGEQ